MDKDVDDEKCKAKEKIGYIVAVSDCLARDAIKQGSFQDFQASVSCYNSAMRYAEAIQDKRLVRSVSKTAAAKVRKIVMSPRWKNESAGFLEDMVSTLYSPVA